MYFGVKRNHVRFGVDTKGGENRNGSNSKLVVLLVTLKCVCVAVMEQVNSLALATGLTFSLAPRAVSVCLGAMSV
jgi:hypothetical protein